MFLRLITVLVWLGLGVVANASAPVIAVVGDSLSAGYGVAEEKTWVTLLQRRLAEKGYGHRVVNASISGDTTAGGLARLPGLLKRESPTLVIIELGGNDGLRALSIDRMTQNLSEMIEMSLANGADVVLAGMQIPPNYGPRYTQSFKSVYPRLAERYDVGLIDFFLAGVALNEDLMQPDGIHPNAEGQPVMLDNAWPVIESRLAERSVAVERPANDG